MLKFINKAEEDLLGSGLEDSFGLYEVVWYLNRIYQEASIAEKYSLADSLVKKALVEGHIKLYEESSTRNSSKDYIKELTKNQSLDLIKAPDTWYPVGTNGCLISYMTTNLGETRYDLLVRERLKNENRN